MPTLADLKYYADTQVGTPYLARLVAVGPSLEGISALAGGSTLGIATPRQQREVQTIRKAAQPVINAVTDPVYAMTPGTDQRRQDARRRILEKVAAVTTDPMAATFAGVGAKMADKAALARSLEMRAAGVPDREIWQQTGWTHGFPDGKPRFEIDDSAAAYAENMPTFDRLKENRPLSDSFNHAEMYENYPETARLTLGEVEGYASGSFDEAAGAVNVNGLFPAKKYTNKRQFKTAQEGITGTTVHELQHAVQGQEGFAIGGNPSSVASQPDELFRLARQYNLIGQGLTDNQIKHKLYNNLAGEVEARLAQRRRDYSPQKRQARYPVDDMDVKPEDQIVRFK